MTDAIVRLNDSLEELPVMLRYEVLDRCCKSVGLPGSPVEAVTFEMLRDKLNDLISTAGVNEFLLTSGLLNMVADSFEYEAQEREQIVSGYLATTAQQIIHDDEIVGDTLKVLFTPVRWQEMRREMQELVRDAPDDITRFKQNATLIRELKQKHFSLNEWSGSIRQLLD